MKWHWIPMTLVLFCSGAAAQQGELILKDSPLAVRSLRESYGGLVTNETITIPGHDFFQLFVAAWRETDTADKYVLSVKERPSLTLGSEISITFGQRKLFQSALPASRIGITALAHQAAEVVYQGAVDTEIQKLLFRDPDLGPDEL